MRGRFIVSLFLLFCGFVFINRLSAGTRDTDRVSVGRLEFAEIPPVPTPQLPDSVDVARLNHKAFWRASAEVVGFNLALWSFDRYIRHGEYSYISWNTIKENFRHGFEWDNDQLLTNIFAHPYNGSLYYNAARSNGYNFWQSSLFTIGGSAMWEMFMEREYPSTNDIIATPVGGTALGEVLYRLSDLVIDDRTEGWERAGREVAAFVLSPMRGLTRVVTGRAWMQRDTPGRRFGIPPVNLSFSLGARLLLFHDYKQYVKGGMTGRVSIEYGDRFAKRTVQPYDYFTFLLDFDVMKGQPLLSRLEIHGRLLSKEIYDSPKSHVSVGMYQHFDFMDSDTISPQTKSNKLFECLVPYKLGVPASLGAGITGRYTESGVWHIEGNAHVNAVFLGGILTDFYRNDERNYNWGTGFSVKGGASCFNRPLGLNMGANIRFYKIYTLKGCDLDYLEYPDLLEPNRQGDKCNTGFFTLNFHCNYRLWHNLYATFNLDWYKRRSHYLELNLKDANEYYLASSPIFKSNQLGLKMMLTYNL